MHRRRSLERAADGGGLELHRGGAPAQRRLLLLRLRLFPLGLRCTTINNLSVPTAPRACTDASQLVHADCWHTMWSKT